jgi:hypothetical protein
MRLWFHDRENFAVSVGSDGAAGESGHLFLQSVAGGWESDVARVYWEGCRVAFTIPLTSIPRFQICYLQPHLPLRRKCLTIPRIWFRLVRVCSHCHVTASIFTPRRFSAT